MKVMDLLLDTPALVESRAASAQAIHTTAVLDQGMASSVTWRLPYLSDVISPFVTTIVSRTRFPI
jgi:hypothetical protein